MSCSNNHQSIYFNDSGSTIACGNCGHIWVCCGTYLGATCGGQCRLPAGALSALAPSGGQTLASPLPQGNTDVALGGDAPP